MILKSIVILATLAVASISASAQETYKNPVDGKNYQADKFNTYQPQINSNPPLQNPFDKVKLEQVILLSSQKDFEEVGSDALADYVKSVQGALEKQAGAAKGSGKILTQIELSSKDNPKISFSYKGDIPKELLEAFYNEAMKAAPLKSKEKKLVFQIVFDVKG